MKPKPDDVCPHPPELPATPTQPLAAPLALSSVYRCADPQQADALLGGDAAGYVYRRDGHPNADVLAEQCRRLHGGERAAVCGSGMAALSAVVLAELRPGDHVVSALQLYGRSRRLLEQECARLGMEVTAVDITDAAAVATAVRRETRLVVAETITNPRLRVPDLARLADIAHAQGARLLVDNTFASPAVCRPLELGADWVVESLTKIMNGHSDVVLGAVVGREAAWQRLPDVLVTWGLGAAPFDCWLAARGLATLALRIERAAANAGRVAEFLAGNPLVREVIYPGLAGHPDQAIARRQFGQRFGSMVGFSLAGGLPAVERFLKTATEIPFAPSLGELGTTVSHPASTSHRGLSPDERAALGIDDGLLRLSVGIESPEWIMAALAAGLAGVE
ncbi:MAG: PLP-dependent aspartate aminotransferase family protein [Pirellulales bacterium]